MVRAMTDTPPRPEIRLLPGHHRRLAAGHPWAFSNEIRMDAAAKAVPPGAPVRLAEAGGKPLGTFAPTLAIVIIGTFRTTHAMIRRKSAFFVRKIGKAYRS